MPETLTLTQNTPNPTPAFKLSAEKRSKHEVGYNHKPYSATVPDWEVSVCKGSSSMTPTYDIYIENQFNKLVGKMNLSPEQNEAFERIVTALAQHAFSDKLIFEDSIEGDVVIGRQTQTVHKVLLINDFGDIMYSVKAKNRKLNHREFIHVSELDEKDLVFRFLT